MDGSYASLLGHWLGLLLTLAILSYLYGRNPLFELAQHLLVGVSIGYVVVVQYFEVLEPNLLVRLGQSGLGPARFLYLVPLVLVLLLFTSRSTSHAWLARYPIALVVGVFAGQQIPALLTADLLAQLGAMARLVADHAELAAAEPGGSSDGLSFASALGLLVLVLGTAAALSRFLYTAAESRALRAVRGVGQILLLITFGAAFGYASMGRLAVAAERLRVLVDGGLATLVLLGLVLLALALDRRRNSRRGPERGKDAKAAESRSEERG